MDDEADNDIKEFLRSKIDNKKSNLIFYGDNTLNVKSLNDSEKHLEYEEGCKSLLEKIASLEKQIQKSGKFGFGKVSGILKNH